MLFNQLKVGDKVHILEVLGTFKKSTVYNTGLITQVTAPYEEPLPQGLYPMPGQVRRKLVDLYITCSGESKKLAVPNDRSIIIDGSLGLTIATDKVEIVNMVRSNYNDCKAKKEAAIKYDEEMDNCLKILEQLDTLVEPTKVEIEHSENVEIDLIKNDILEIKDIISDVKKLFPFGNMTPPIQQTTALTKVD